ncbi:RNA polymerase sigma factor [Phycisphaerae bacterium RAS1]|nr:RNA polymerase sigma factor [Phycisphaerae bacterium RAS1]
MTDFGVTRLLTQTQAGDGDARRELFAIVHEELRRLAHSQMKGERRAVTLNTTVLVNEAYLRLMGDGAGPWNGRAHFFAAAAEAMRRIRVDAARARRRRKRGGGPPVSLEAAGAEEAAWVDPADDDQLIGIDEALPKLAELYPRQAEVVKYRFYSGLSVDETAAVLDVSPRTVDADWRLARAWLHRELGGE